MWVFSDSVVQNGKMSSWRSVEKPVPALAPSALHVGGSHPWLNVKIVWTAFKYIRPRSHPRPVKLRSLG